MKDKFNLEDWLLELEKEEDQTDTHYSLYFNPEPSDEEFNYETN